MKSKKIVFSAPWQVEFLEEAFDAAAIPAGHVAVKTAYTLVSPGTDMSCLAGQEGWFRLPNTPGYTAVGEVIGSGAGETRFRNGDKVFFYGSNRQYQLVPPDELIIRLPENMTGTLAPFTRLATIAMTAIRVAGIELGDTVLVTGLGPVGNFAVQLAKLSGATVIGTDLSAHRRELARRSGADHVFTPAADDLKAKIAELTGGAGVDVAIEATGATQVIESTLPLVRAFGELILLGTPRAEYITNAAAMYRQTHDGACVTVKGASEWLFPELPDKFVKHSMERNSRIALELIRDGRLQVEPLLSHLLSPAEAASAYAGVRTDKENYFGVVFDWTLVK